jgi:hypothetical protein
MRKGFIIQRNYASRVISESAWCSAKRIDGICLVHWVTVPGSLMCDLSKTWDGDYLARVQGLGKQMPTWTTLRVDTYRGISLWRAWKAQGSAVKFRALRNRTGNPFDAIFPFSVIQ